MLYLLKIKWGTISKLTDRVDVILKVMWVSKKVTRSLQ